MEVIKYKYSVYQTWFAVILFSVLILLCLYGIITDTPGHNIWELMGPAILFLAAMLAYLSRKYFLPLQKAETALELDNEKLQYFIGNKTVYWKDVLYTNFGGLQHGGAEIRFSLESGIDVSIITKYVAGNDNEIYKAITAYLEHYKSI